MLLRSLLLFAFALSCLAQTEQWNNPVRALLKEGKPVIGATITTHSPDVAAAAANVGFDFLWIEMEHSGISLETARNMILATRSLKAVPFIRVPVNEVWTAKRALDVGALGVIFPFTSTPELARQAVAACKYPPVGRRGYGPGLASSRWPAPEGYAKFADRNVMVIIIIEEQRAVDNIDAILDVPGIDVVFIGVNDLSYSMGIGGQMDSPRFKEAVAKVIAAAKKRGLPVGRPGGTPDQVAQLQKEGFSFFQGPSDLVLMGNGARTLLQPMGKSGHDPKTRPLY